MKTKIAHDYDNFTKAFNKLNNLYGKMFNLKVLKTEFVRYRTYVTRQKIDTIELEGFEEFIPLHFKGIYNSEKNQIEESLSNSYSVNFMLDKTCDCQKRKRKVNYIINNNEIHSFNCLKKNYDINKLKIAKKYFKIFLLFSINNPKFSRIETANKLFCTEKDLWKIIISAMVDYDYSPIQQIFYKDFFRYIELDAREKKFAQENKFIPKQIDDEKLIEINKENFNFVKYKMIKNKINAQLILKGYKKLSIPKEPINIMVKRILVDPFNKGNADMFIYTKNQEFYYVKNKNNRYQKEKAKNLAQWASPQYSNRSSFSNYHRFLSISEKRIKSKMFHLSNFTEALKLKNKFDIQDINTSEWCSVYSYSKTREKLALAEYILAENIINKKALEKQFISILLEQWDKSPAVRLFLKSVPLNQILWNKNFNIFDYVKDFNLSFLKRFKDGKIKNIHQVKQVIIRIYHSNNYNPELLKKIIIEILKTEEFDDSVFNQLEKLYETKLNTHLLLKKENSYHPMATALYKLKKFLDNEKRLINQIIFTYNLSV